MLKDALARWIAPSITGEVTLELRRGDDYTIVSTSAPHMAYDPHKLSMEKVESLFSPEDRMGALEMQNLSVLDNRAFLITHLDVDARARRRPGARPRRASSPRSWARTTTRSRASRLAGGPDLRSSHLKFTQDFRGLGRCLHHFQDAFGRGSPVTCCARRRGAGPRRPDRTHRPRAAAAPPADRPQARHPRAEGSGEVAGRAARDRQPAGRGALRRRGDQAVRRGGARTRGCPTSPAPSARSAPRRAPIRS